MTPARTTLAPGFEIAEVVTGLWQVADMERDGRELDREAASSVLLDYARAGFDTFDMADHYGSAELIAGRMFDRVAADARRAGAPAADLFPAAALRTHSVGAAVAVVRL